MEENKQEEIEEYNTSVEKKTLIFIVFGIVFLSLVVSGIWIWNKNQKERNECINECFYIKPIEAKEKSGGFINPQSGDKGDYWKFEDRNFETQEQCIDYCLIKK